MRFIFIPAIANVGRRLEDGLEIAFETARAIDAAGARPYGPRRKPPRLRLHVQGILVR